MKGGKAADTSLVFGFYAPPMDKHLLRLSLISLKHLPEKQHAHQIQIVIKKNVQHNQQNVNKIELRPNLIENLRI